MTLQQRLVTNCYQQQLLVNPDDEIGSHIIRYGLYDGEGLQVIERLLKSLCDPIVFDIGANIGNHAIAMSQWCQHVYCFEPQPEFIKQLKQQFELNQIKNFTVFPFGLSHKTGQHTYFINQDGNYGASTFVAELKSKNYFEQLLPLKVGDQVVAEENIERVDFIKIDVEGFEAEVFKGLQQTILRHKPIITFEWNNQITRNRFKELDIFNTMLSDYEPKALLSNYHKSHWTHKTLRGLRRSIYRSTHLENWWLGSFLPEHQYTHVFLFPKHLK